MLKIYRLNLKQNTYDVTLKYRGVGVRVTFTDGNTYYGTPARCHTRDPFKQRAIEASQMFADKDITLEKSIAEPGDEKPKAKKPAPKPAPKPEPAPEPAPAPEPEPAPVPEQEGEGEAAPEPAAEAAGDPDTMEFQNLAEAIQYIAATWQIAVETENEARTVLKEHGITPKIKRG